MTDNLNAQKVEKVLPYLLLGSGVGYVLFIVCLLSCFHLFTYQNIVDLVQEQYPHLAKFDEWQRQLFTLQHYRRFQYLSYFIVPVLGIVLYFMIFTSIALNACKSLSVSTLKLLRKGWHSWSTLENKDQIWLVAVLLGVSLFRAHYFLQTAILADDETRSYAWFSSQGWWLSLAHYPEPNNHVLYNLFTVFWLKVGIPDLLAIRLTSFISLIGILLIGFTLAKQFYSLTAARYVLLSLGITFSANLYACQGRGYLLLSFWALLALVTLWLWINKKLGTALFVCCCVLGFFTIPTFIFPYLFFLVISLWKGAKNVLAVKKVILMHMTIGGLTLLLYLPLLLFSSPSALFANEYVAKHDYQFLLDNTWLIIEYFNYIVGVPAKAIFFLGVSVSVALILWRKKQLHQQTKQMLSSVLLAIGLAILLVLLQAYYPPHRTFTYLAFWLAIGLALLLTDLMRTVRLILTPWRLFLVGGMLLVSLHYWHQSFQAHYLNFMLSNQPFVDLRTAYLPLREQQVKTIFSEDRYCFPCQHFDKFALLNGNRLRWVDEVNDLLEADALIITDSTRTIPSQFYLSTVVERRYLAPHYIYIKK
ncbi:MAG: hypothetical protein ACPGJS_20625 [Flammeovirgaceae bacterium]